jgi:PKD repeat protein
MRKFLTFLTISLFVVVGTAVLTGTGQEMSRADVCVGPDIVTIDVSSAESGVTLLDQDRNGLTVRMDVGRIHFVPISTKEGPYILPRIDGFSRSFEVGDPTLPLASKLISIPFDCKLKTDVLDSTTQDIDLAAYGLASPFMPVQPPLSKSENPALVPFIQDHDVYNAGGKYALPLVSTEILGTMRALHLGKLAVSPLEYYPGENRITVYTSVTVRVKYQNPNWAKTDALKKNLASPFFDAVNTQILNYESDPFEADLVKYPIKYAVVSDRMFESQLQPFIQWKTEKGFNVVVGYTDTVGSSTSAIKGWIEGLYNAGTPEDPAPSFVLFVGDDQQIPAWSGSSGSHITDLRYCEFTGDDLPEIYYGRFSAQNTAELQPQIDKTLEYEQYTMPDPGYLAEVTLVSGVDSGYADPYGNGQINYGTTYYFNSAHGISPNVWLYPASDGSGVPAAVRQTISDGVGFYNYTAHCSHTGPQDPSFTTSDIDNLTNIHKYLLGVGNCCLSNTFGDDYSTPCFGEKWLQAADKGGIGWIGGSNSTYWDEDYWWGVGNGPIVGSGPTYEQTGIGAYDGTFHDHGEPVTLHYTTNGSMIFAGNTAVTEAGSSRTQYYWEIYHLMGDPSVMTYMGVPTTNNVIHPASVLTTDTSVNVQAQPGSYAGITLNGVLHGAGYIGSSGSAAIPLTPFGTEGLADIVVTCQFKIPYISTISITGATEPPTADFAGSPLSGMVPLPVQFTDQSIGATSWSWDFGDTGTSTERNPGHTYNSAGTYTVTLTVTNSYGSDAMVKTGYITVTPLQPPVADFTASSTDITIGDSVTFTDLTANNPSSWSWTFAGGTPGTGTDQNPTVTYNTAGTYSVTLFAANAAGSDTETKSNYINVAEKPYCASQGNNYSYEWIERVVVGPLDNSSGAAGYTDFTSITVDLTAGNTYDVALTPGFSSTIYTEYWKIWIDYNGDHDFEDTGEEVFSGIGTSTVTGNFTVPADVGIVTRMRVSMKWDAWQTPCEAFSYGEVEDYTVDIAPGTQPPVADFTASATTITEGDSVTFTDLSTGNPDAWDWTFAGGTPGTGTGQNPTVTYNTPGTYDVTLVATNAYGSDTETKVGYITVEPAGQPPVADFTASATTITEGDSVTFTDLSGNGPNTLDWTFPGGTPGSSTAQNPTVTYNTAGTYDVTLVATNAYGGDTETKTGYITVLPAGSCIGEITNPGFETGTTSGWTGTGTVSIIGDVHSGSYAVSLEGAGSRVEQVITGLCANTAYTVSAWGKAKSNAGFYLGVSNYGGADQTVPFTDSKNYTQQSITFTTGAANTSVTIFLNRTSSKFTASGDDVTIVKN